MLTGDATTGWTITPDANYNEITLMLGDEVTPTATLS